MTSAEIPPAPSSDDQRPWYQLLNRYHWFVFLVATLGWLFDAMDQQLFVLSRAATMSELIAQEHAQDRPFYEGIATAIFIIGWASGGLIFGILGDRFGRARMMLVTILLYSIFTGISAFSQTFWDFTLWRFLTGIGVGGEFAVGIALISETLPERARPHALGWLQALSTVGNVTAALIATVIVPADKFTLFGAEWTGWRVMFLIGTLPALLALVIRWHLKEPERWTAVATGDKVKEQLGSVRSIFGDPTLRRNAFVGLALAISGVIGLWGMVFFIFSFVKELFGGKQIGNASLMLNAGGFVGMWAFSRVTQKIGRKPSFAIFFIVAMISIASTFWFMSALWHLYVLIPLMGFGIFSLFAGYAIYLPELFPTRVRSTGVSFCYNVGRFIAAIGPFTLGVLTAKVFSEYGPIMKWRYSGVSMSLFLLIGLFALPFAPETKDQPLPE